MNTWTIALTPKQQEKFISYLHDSEFIQSSPKNPYMYIQAKKKGVTCSLYKSGKLVLQGSEIKPFIEFILEPQILEDTPYTQSSSHIKENISAHIGSDEAGKGDFFGPLCVAAVYASTQDIQWLRQTKICDSKKLSDKVILQLYPQLIKKLKYEKITLMPFKYNELYTKIGNLNHLLAWAHVRLLLNLSPKVNAQYALVDQFANPSVILNKLPKDFSLEVRQQHRAEEDIVVAAASVIARAEFVMGIESLSKKIGVELPKGAGNKVLEVGKKLVKNQGEEVLKLVSKTHFSTYNKIT